MPVPDWIEVLSIGMSLTLGIACLLSGLVWLQRRRPRAIGDSRIPMRHDAPESGSRPEGDWNIRQALAYLRTHAGLSALDALDELRLAASSSAVTVWGRREVRRDGSDLRRPLRRIGRDYWLEAGFDPATCHADNNAERASTALHNPDEWVALGTYVDLRFSAAEIRRRWPEQR